MMSSPLSLLNDDLKSQSYQTQKQNLAIILEQIDAAFWRDGLVRDCVNQRALALDALLKAQWQQHFSPHANMALIATGGYGRSELFPASDVDLLLLYAGELEQSKRAEIALWETHLWQLGLRPGLAVRSILECVESAQSDISIFTSLLDARLLTGAENLFTQMRMRAGSESALWPIAEFFHAKVHEQKQRHMRLRDSAYNLEPNLKEGRGGLRDSHLLYWLGVRFCSGQNWQTIIGFSEIESARLAQAENILMQYRYALHCSAKRAEERLLFDHQRVIAEKLVTANVTRENDRVEIFMQAYFRAAEVMDRLCARALQSFAEIAHGPNLKPAQHLAPGFIVVNELIDADERFDNLTDLDAIFTPFALLLAQANCRGLRHTLQRRIELRLEAASIEFLHGETCAFALLALLSDRGDVASMLRELARLTVLARILPPFAAIVGRMQYDMFHVYTVDQHSLRVVEHLHRFSREDAEPILAREVFLRIRKPELLWIAGLFHDIAKGRGGDHSELGEIDVREFAARAGINRVDTELLAWLVRYHLDMSTTAQRKDITDPDVVHNFAEFVAELERLDYLYLLTIADISGTSPSLWNSWKDQLLADLYRATHFVLASGMERPIDAELRIAEARHATLILLQNEHCANAKVEQILNSFPSESFLRYSPEQIAWQARGISEAKCLPVVLLRARGARGSTEIFVHAQDRAGLFATITATLDRLQLNILDARIVTANNARSLDTFQVLARDGRMLEEDDALQEIAHVLRVELGQDPLRPKISKRMWSRQQKHFRIPAQVRFSELVNPARSQLSLICSDRPGLLAALAQCFLQAEVNVMQARIATFGERVEDFFELQDHANQALDEDLQTRLRDSIVRALDLAATK